MNGWTACFHPDGSCQFVDAAGECDVIWASVHQWASAWWDEWRSNEHLEACRFIAAACDDATAGVVDALAVLASTAADDIELAWIGAGPLEDLVAHSGNGLHVLAEVERAARRDEAFRTALASTWLGDDVPQPVRDRLGVFGARTLADAERPNADR